MKVEKLKELDMEKLKEIVNNSLKVVGTKQVLKAIIFSLDKIMCVVLAKDANSEVIEPIIDLCQQKEVQLYMGPNKKVLGAIAGIEVNASSLAIMN